MGGGDWMAQQTSFDCPVCPTCPMVDWKPGFLDGTIQWIRTFGNWADIIVSFIFVLGGILFLIFFPPTRNALGFFVRMIKNAWEATKRKGRDA